MSELRNAAQQARTVLANARDYIYLLETGEVSWSEEDQLQEIRAAIEALRSALAEPEQKPVAWMDREGDVYKELPSPSWCPPHTPLYTHPPTPRKPLTDEEIVDIWAAVSMGYDDEINIIELARAIERAHGIGEQK